MHSTFGHLPQVLAPALLHASLALLRIFAALAVAAAILIPLERLAPLKRAGVLRAALIMDLIYYFMASTIPFRLMQWPTAALAWTFHSHPFSDISTFVETMPLWARLAAALVVNEVGIYWGHRLCHEIPFLWRFHAIHHSPEHMDFWVGTRLHPLDPAFTALCGLVPAYALGLASATSEAGTITAITLSLVGTTWHFFIHANTRLRLGFIEQIFTSPAFHHWHHTVEAPLDRNYANLLPWLDRIFGTYYLPAKEWPVAYGLKERLSPTITGQLVDPMKPLVAPLWRPFARPRSGQPTA